jgi:hypothetical protein
MVSSGFLKHKAEVRIKHNPRGKKPPLGNRNSFSKKKALQAELAQGAAPVFLDPLTAFPFVTSRRLSFLDKAGLLTFGSSYHPHLPIQFMNSGIFADFVPDYSGGTAPEFHGIPLKLFTEHLVDIFSYLN